MQLVISHDCVGRSGFSVLLEQESRANKLRGRLSILTHLYGAARALFDY